jgi:fucose permease
MPSTQPLILARRAVTIVFLVNGAGMGLWAGHIPIVKERLDLSAGALGVALLAMALGAMLAMPLTGWLTSRFGSRPCVIGAGAAYGLLLAGPVLAPSWPTLILATLLLGAANGATDVAMNTQAAAVQRGWGHAIMSAFHAFFSLGGLAGAGLAAALLALGDDPRLHMSIMALILAGIVLALGGTLHRDEPEGGGAFALPRGAALALGILALLAILAEGAMLDWSGVYLLNVLGAGPSLAAMGYGTFSAAMTIGRLTGDRFVRWAGERRALILSGLLAALGLALSLLAPDPLLAIPGFALAGLGLANMVPVLFSAGSHIPGVAPGVGVAMVATMGYAGGLIGPALIGFAAEATTLGAALWLLVLSCLIVALAAIWGHGAAGATAASP